MQGMKRSSFGRNSVWQRVKRCSSSWTWRVFGRMSFMHHPTLFCVTVSFSYVMWSDLYATHTVSSSSQSLQRGGCEVRKAMVLYRRGWQDCALKLAKFRWQWRWGVKDLVKGGVFLRGFVGPTFRELGLSLDLQISSYTWHLMSHGNIDFQMSLTLWLIKHQLTYYMSFLYLDCSGVTQSQMNLKVKS